MTAVLRVTPDKESAFTIDISEELRHAMNVSNLAYRVGQELSQDEETCHQLAIAGMLHDIGKLRLAGYLYGQQDSMVVEELKYVRMHPQLGYEAIRGQGYTRLVEESVLYHHENYDGSGYPSNMQGGEIPLGARILRVCDVYSALRTDRPYRGAFDVDTAMELMIEEVKNFDMRVFLAFQRVVHK